MLTFTTSLLLLLSTININADTAVAGVANAPILENTVLALDSKEDVVDQPETLENYVRSYFADTPVLAKVAWCESKFRQYAKSGKVLRGELTPADVGVMQINEYYHLDTAVKLGYDIHTVDGNLDYAKYLYEKQGTQPWSASKHCWSKK